MVFENVLFFCVAVVLAASGVLSTKAPGERSTVELERRGHVWRFDVDGTDLSMIVKTNDKGVDFRSVHVLISDYAYDFARQHESHGPIPRHGSYRKLGLHFS